MLKPAVWLALGLLAAFVYVYGPAFAESGLMDGARLPDPLFPSQAVILSVLLLTQRRWWWFYLAVYYGIQVAQGLWSGLPGWYAAMSNIANILEPLVGAYLISRFMALPPAFARLRDVSIYVGCVVLGSTIGATWGSMSRALWGFPFWESWSGWFLADVLSSLILAPTITLSASVGWRAFRPESRARLLEAIVLALGLTIVGAVVFGTRTDNVQAAPARLYLPIFLLMWSAVRFGPRGVVTALSFFTVLAIAGAANEQGPFEGRAPEVNVYVIQMYLFAVGVPLLFLAALVQERRVGRMALEQSEERYRSVLSNLPNATVLLYGSDLRHVFADGQGLSDIGLAADTLAGKTAWESFPADIAAALAPHYARALEGESTAVELAHEGRIYQAHVVPIVETGHQHGMVVMQEITDQRRAEALAELDRSKTTFFSNVSHEFRTPLTLVLGGIEEALQHAESDEESESLAVAYRYAQRLLKLTNTLLDFARIEAGRADAAFERVDLTALTRDVVAAFRSVIESAGLRLVLDCPQLRETVDIYVDPDLWEKVVLNLLSNAVKFTLDGEIAVSLRTTEDESNVVLVVRDSGVGIAADELPHLFDRFYRIRGQRARTHEGSGIGLALVNELVKLHGGTIRASSQLGVGTEFVVTLPVGYAHLPADWLRSRGERSSTSSVSRPYVEEALGWSSGDPPDALILPGRDELPTNRPRIVVADDNADVRTYVARLLSREYAVETAADGEAALCAIFSHAPDLVIADIMMPGLDGLDLLRAVRNNESTRALPVMLLSARAGEEAREEGLRAGADDYLVKPFAARELLARVSAHLALQQQRQRMLDAERAARTEAEIARLDAEKASERALSILAVTSAVARSVTLQEVGDAVIRHALPVVGATAGTLLLRTENPGVLALISPTGYSQAVEELYRHVPLDAAHPGAQVIRTPEPMWIASASEAGDMFPYWTARPTGHRALAALPLVVDGETVGSLVIGFTNEHEFSIDDRAFLLTLAGQCAGAIRRVQLHSSAESARRDAETALQARDEFLRALAHDLKTPIVALAWHLQILASETDDHSLPANLISSARAAKVSARELMAHIDELRDLVQHMAGEPLPLQVEALDAVALVSAVVAAKANATDHQVRIVPHERALFVQGDRARLQRAFANVLENALKFSPGGSEVVVDIARTARDGQDWVLIKVKDNGVGIPLGDQAFVFDRYFRGSNTSHTPGEGIGLASARQFVERHGGRMTLESVPGCGSTFLMWLPEARRETRDSVSPKL